MCNLFVVVKQIGQIKQQASVAFVNLLLTQQGHRTYYPRRVCQNSLSTASDLALADSVNRLCWQANEIVALSED